MTKDDGGPAKMSDDLVEQLRSLARFEHADLSIGDEAAAEIIRLRAVNAELVETLEWALAEIDGRTRYSDDGQRERCMSRARTVLSKNDGGPAFPIPYATDTDGYVYAPHASGMSLRDWFAGMALQGMLAHSTRYRPRPGASSNWHEAISEEAYHLSDAMLAEREKRDE